jgi:glucosamine kinase
VKKLMAYVIGIDGGGSNVRVVVATPAMQIVGQASGSSANPNSAGREAAAAALQSTIHAALADAGLTVGDISAAAAGVAGALTTPTHNWLSETLSPVLPDMPLLLSSDAEIALMGAHGERRGVLVLSGTGSAIYGVNAAGETAVAGGWGYLLGDEGSGYWIALQALQAVANAADGLIPSTRLSQIIFDKLTISDARQMVNWLYGQFSVKLVASLAPLILATEDDPAVQQIIERGAAELAARTRVIMHRLNMPDAPIAFAGGLLGESNLLSRRLCEMLDLTALPVSKYSPVMGAVILALDLIGLKPHVD